MAPLVEAWRDLLRRSLEPNIFLDPDFALAAFAYLRPHNFKIAVVFEPGAERRLLALMPLALPAMRFGLARVPVHKQAALGLPLLDRAQAGRALDALLDAIRQFRRRRARWSSATFRVTARPSALSPIVSRTGGRCGYSTNISARPCSRPHTRRSIARPRRARTISRLLRRLAEHGALSYRISRGADAIGATAEFLALEATGWKGASRTALASTPERAAFAVAMTEALARSGKLHVESLDLDGRPIAMGLIIEEAGATYFWKTAYDEAHAALSPGVLFVRELTSRLLASGTFMKADSCAMPTTR